MATTNLKESTAAPSPFGGQARQPSVLTRFTSQLARAEELVGQPEFDQAVRDFVALADPIQDELAADKLLGARFDSVFAATDRDDGLTPIAEEALAHLGEAERALDQADHEALLDAVATLRLMEIGYGLPAMLLDSDSRDRYDCVLQALKEWRHDSLAALEVEYRRPRFGHGQAG